MLAPPLPEKVAEVSEGGGGEVEDDEVTKRLDNSLNGEVDAMNSGLESFLLSGRACIFILSGNAYDEAVHQVQERQEQKKWRAFGQFEGVSLFVFKRTIL